MGGRYGRSIDLYDIPYFSLTLFVMQWNPAYGHPVNMVTSLLPPLYSGQKRAQPTIFLFEKPFKYGNLVNKARLLWPVVYDRVNGIGR